jgi:hypothetical protein
VDILAVQLSKREDELLQQKAEVTKIAASLKLVSSRLLVSQAIA